LKGEFLQKVLVSDILIHNVDTVSRRDILRTAGSVILMTGVSGCLGNDDEDDDTNTADVDSRFAGEDCPSFRDTDETNCYHEVGTEPDVYLMPENEAGNPAEQEITFILHNDSDSAVWSTPLSISWSLYKLMDGEWRLLTPFKTVPLVSEPLDSGGFHTWSLEMSNDVEMPNRLSPRDSDMAYTGMGRYAFSVSVSTEDGGGGEDTELVALFHITGEPLELEPIMVKEHEIEDETVRVRMESGEEEGDSIVLSAREVDGGGVDVEPMLTEIATQLHPIRNTVYFFDRYDAEEVRFEGNSSLAEELSILRRAASIYTETQDGSIIEVTEDEPVEDFPYRFRFLHEGSYYELAVKEHES